MESLGTQRFKTMTAVSRRLDETPEMLSEFSLGKAPSPDEGKDVR
jgi:hypothetical protein